jgi:predicted metal-dependent phosphoesterase TrpH
MTQSPFRLPADNPFRLPGRWYRGNLHTHTTCSDGALSPAQVAAWYCGHGYHFVALTDHERVTDVSTAVCAADADADGARFVVVPGAEISVGRSRQGSPVHIVAIGVLDGLPAPDSLTPTDALAWGWQAGAFVFLAHPHWSGMSTDELAAISSVPAIEAFNFGSELENHKGWATVYWDDVLGRGHPLLGVATDDSHFQEADHGGGWVMVKAAELTPTAIVTALRAGHFYSSAGPTIRDVQMVEGRLTVHTSPATAIYWIGAGCLGWHVHAAPRQTLVSAEFALPPDLDWIRIEVCDAQHRWAWSNPLFLRQLDSQQEE